METSSETTNYGELHKLFDENFLDYTSYVIKERAIPDINDGLKPVQRRILQTLHNMDDGRFHKVANVVGDTMKLHPHGDASIFSALVNLANKNYLIDRQGNFGNIYTGDQASAARYIECRLSPLAREVLFNKDLTEYVDSYDGRLYEPVSLPAKIPLLLLLGTEGIAVGMATKILPHNFCELLEAQKNILRDKPFTIYPDFLVGGFIDISSYEQGNGRIRSRAKIIEKNEKTIVITEIPYGTTTQSLIDSIEKAAKAGKIKIFSIDDYTAEQVEIEIKLSRGLYAADTVRALYAFTDCEVSISPNLTVLRENNPVTISVDEVLRYNTEKLVKDLERELNIDLGRLKEKLHANLLEQIFIEERLYKQIEESKSYIEVVETIGKALAPYLDKLIRGVSREDIDKLLEIKIKRISRYDINKKRKDVKAIRDAIKTVETNLKDMVKYTIKFLDDLLKRYGHFYPRRTEITTFQEVQARKVALSNLTIGYDQKDGFLGHQVKADGEISFACSEYDKLLLMFKSGMYKVIHVTDKVFVGHDLLWAGIIEKKLFTFVYREGKENLSYLKRFRTPKFILDKEYRLFPENKKSVIQYFTTQEQAKLRIHMMPSKRSKSNILDIDLNDFLIKGPAAIGKRVSNRVVRRVVEISEQEATQQSQAPEKQPKLFDSAKQEDQ